jgi:hypothetical protein
MKDAMNPLNCPKPKEAQMRLSPQRLLAGLLIAAMAFITACSSDSPTAPNPGGGGGGTGGLNLVLTTSNANPIQGTCVLVQGFATINGVPVPNGTSIVFTLQSGIGATFEENNGVSISVVSQGGVASTLVCSANIGTVTVKGTVVLNGRQADRNLTITFTSNGQVLCPLISQCANPSSGPVTGGQTVTITGCGFCPSGVPATCLANTRVFFRHNGISHVASISSVTDTQITITTPAFPEIDPASATPVDVVVVLGAGTTLISPNCFTYTGTSLVPFVSAILPSSGTKLGGTRVTILGNNFTAPVQVFFQGTGAPGDGFQAEVTSVTFNQIIALTPPVLQTGAYAVVVKNAVCQAQGGGLCLSNLDVSFTYTVPIVITAIAPGSGLPGTVVTIFGGGFVAPVAVSFGSDAAAVSSVTGTQILAIAPTVCDGGGVVSVTNISTGETAIGPIFAIVKTAITSGPTPPSGPGGATTSVTIFGTGLLPASLTVSGGTATITSSTTLPSGTDQLVFDLTPDPCAASMTVTILNTLTGCFTSFTFTNSTPIAAMVATLAPPTGVGDIFTFNATVTGGLAPLTYSWNFGDGITVVTGPTAARSDTQVHTYAPATTYTGSLTVTDSCTPVHTFTAPFTAIAP